MSKVLKESLLSQFEEFISSISENDKQRLLNSLPPSSQHLKKSKNKERKSEDIEVKTSNNHTHTGYRRKEGGRSVIYERREAVERHLARRNYTIPHEKLKGSKPLKSDGYFTDQKYGEAQSQAWNAVADNLNASVKENQKRIDDIFKDFIK
jgi:hypothetical protein